MKIEDLVPPLDLCKRIPAGHFEDSALVWMTNHGDSPIVEPRRYAPEEFEECPAPTLEEILAELSFYEPVTVSQWRTGQIVVTCQRQGEEKEQQSAKSAATAALKLWLELEGGK